jgi:hypothetical protein
MNRSAAIGPPGTDQGSRRARPPSSGTTRTGNSLPLAALLTAKAVSDIGAALDFICITVFVWVRLESVPATGAVGLSLYAGGIVGGRLGQRYGGRWNRRRAMVFADLARMLALLPLAVLPDGAQTVWLFPAVFVVGAGRSVFEASLAAATPVLAGERAQFINSLVSGLKGLSLVLGMGLATVAVPVVGFRGVFLLDAVSYALSAVVLLALPLSLSEPGREPDPASATAEPRAKVHAWAAAAGAGLGGLLIVRGLDAFGSASHHVGLPVIGARIDPDNPAGVTGALWMGWAVGTLLGSFVLRPLLAGVIARAPAIVFYVATAVMSAGFIGIFWFGPWSVMLLAAGVGGLGDALSEITFKQTIQKLPDVRRGPAFGSAQVVINAGFTAGLLITGLALAPEAVAGWVLVLHSIPLVTALGAMLWQAQSGSLVHLPGRTIGGTRWRT